MKCTKGNKEEKRLMNKRVKTYKDLKDLWKSNKTSSKVKTYYKAVNFTLTKKKRE